MLLLLFLCGCLYFLMLEVAACCYGRGCGVVVFVVEVVFVIEVV